MNIEKAKQLLELQSCIVHLLDKFMIEVESLDVAHERDSLRKSTAEAIGTCVCDIIIPITRQHPSLDHLGENPLAKKWWDEARRRRLKLEASNA